MIRKIILFVLSAHIALLLAAILFQAASPKPPEPKKFLAKTVKLQPSTPSAARASPSKKQTPPPQPPPPKPKKKEAPPPPEPKAPEKKPTPPPKESAAKPAPSPKKVAEVKKPTPKKAEPQKPKAVVPDHLLKELEESFAKIDQKRDKLKKSPRAESPSFTQTSSDFVLSVDQDDSSEEELRAALIGFLHDSLHLPDFGEVTIKLTLLHDGKVGKLIVLKSESERNRRYLEEKLPKLLFPLLRGTQAERETSWVLTFCNEL